MSIHQSILSIAFISNDFKYASYFFAKLIYHFYSNTTNREHSPKLNGIAASPDIMDSVPKSPAQRYLQNSRYYPKKTENSTKKSNDFTTDIKNHHKTTGNIRSLNMISKYDHWYFE